jgi:hypothetical protein
MTVANLLYELKFEGTVLARGFWLYVWEVTPPNSAKVYYVGRTGDSSSINAQSPFNRMGQHLGFAKNSNMLRRWLSDRNIEPTKCSYRLISHGPVLEETKDEHEYKRRRDVVASIEKALEGAMRRAGYDVLNQVKCRMPLDEKLFHDVLRSFAAKFPGLVVGDRTGSASTT